ncbi:MAG: STAS domain-containing protein [Ilumatobacteraceae bacterium]
MTEAGTNDTLHVHVAADGVIVASGDVDVAGGPILDAAIVEQERRLVPGHSIVIDLTDVTFIDSSGLRSLLGASRRAGERAGAVVLRSPSPSVRRLLEITGTAAQFRIEGGDAGAGA